MISRPELLMAVAARLEQADAEVAERARGFLGSPPEDRERARVEALAEIWRRDKLRTLRQEIVAQVKGTDEGAVMLFALDAVDPLKVPSFQEWLEERDAAKVSHEGHGIPPR